MIHVFSRDNFTSWCICTNKKRTVWESAKNIFTTELSTEEIGKGNLVKHITAMNNSNSTFTYHGKHSSIEEFLLSHPELFI